MREDLRYLESLIVEIDYDSHPNSQTLSNFINRKLDQKEREEIFNHLIHCKTCSDTVVNSIPSKEEFSVANNIPFRPIVIALIASLIVFVNLPITNSIETIGSIPPIEIYKGDHDQAWVNKSIDADKILASIIKSTDLSHIKSFDIAQREENIENFEKAQGLYRLAFAKISTEKDTKKRLEYTIVIYNRLLQISHKLNQKESLKNHKNFLRYKIREYNSKYNK